MGHASKETPASFKEFNFTTELTKMPTNKLLSKGKTGYNFLRIYTVSHKNKLKKKKKRAFQGDGFNKFQFQFDSIRKHDECSQDSKKRRISWI